MELYANMLLWNASLYICSNSKYVVYGLFKSEDTLRNISFRAFHEARISR